jgi:hypothetical protein
LWLWLAVIANQLLLLGELLGFFVGSGLVVIGAGAMVVLSWQHSSPILLELSLVLKSKTARHPQGIQ